MKAGLSMKQKKLKQRGLKKQDIMKETQLTLEATVPNK